MENVEKNWVENRVSTIEEIFERIQKLPRPIGIVLFGADSRLKDKIRIECENRVDRLATGYGGKGDMTLQAAKRPLSEGVSTLSVMPGDTSGDAMQRADIGTTLKKLGAKTTVGIYARADPIYLNNDQKTNHAKVEEIKIINDQIKTLECDPPMPGEFDYFVTKYE